MKTYWTTLPGIIIALLFLTSSGVYAGDQNDAQMMFEKKCSTCHGLERPRSKAKTEKEWSATVLRMKSKGAALSDKEVKMIVGYLAINYPKK